MSFAGLPTEFQRHAGDSPEFPRSPRDEAFISDQSILERWGALPPNDPKLIANGQWPASLPLDFDHQLLREMGLACGSDEAAEHYTLLREPGGWRVWKVSDLVDLIAPVFERPKGEAKDA